MPGLSTDRLADIARGNLVSMAEVRSLAAEVAALRVSDVDRPTLRRAADTLRAAGDVTAALCIERVLLGR